MSTDLGIISSNDSSGSDDMVVLGKIYSITLNSKTGGYCEFLKLLEYKHKVIASNYLSIGCDSFCFEREELIRALNNLENPLFKKWVLGDVNSMLGSYLYLYLI